MKVIIRIQEVFTIKRLTLSNHPEILPILLENPESRPICDRDRQNPDFDICFDKYTRTPNRVYLTRLIPRKRKYTAWNIKQNQVLVCENTQIKIGIKITINLANILERITLSEHKKFSRVACCQTPCGSHPPRSRYSSVIKKYPDFTYSKGWTVTIDEMRWI